MANITHILMKKQGAGLIQGLPELSFMYHEPTRDTLSNWSFIRVQFGDYQNDPLSDPTADGITTTIQSSADSSFSTAVEGGTAAFTNGYSTVVRFPYEWSSGQKYVRAKFTNNLGQVGYSNVLSTYTTGLTVSMSSPAVNTGITVSVNGSPHRYWAIDNFRVDYDEPVFISTETRNAGPIPRVEWAGSGTGRIVDYNETGQTQWCTFYDPQGAAISASPQMGTVSLPTGNLPINVPVGSIRVSIQQANGMYFRFPDVYTAATLPSNFTDPVNWLTGAGIIRFSAFTI